MKPELVAGLLLILAVSQIVAAIYLLAGFGWSLLALGIATLLFALLIVRGAANG